MSDLNFSIVVLDGANIIHDNLKNGEITLEPKRLLSAIDHCVSKGWETLAVLKQGTFWYAKKNLEELEEGDFEILQKMVDEGKIELIAQKDEDIYWIDTALEDDGYIITKDTFKDKHHGETIIQRERSLYPDKNWDEIDKRTLDYNFVRGKFRCPNLPDKPDFVPNDSLEKLQEEVVQLRHQLDDEIVKNRALTAQLKANSKIQTSYDDKVIEIFDGLLGAGEEIDTVIVYNELARVILELPNDTTQWPPNWPKNLKQKLGFPRNKKYTSFFEDLSQLVANHTNHRIEFNSNRSRVKYAL